MIRALLRTAMAVRVFSLLCALYLSNELLQAQSSATEDEIRASMVQHLALFVDWPSWKMDTAHPQFNVCLLGADPIGPALVNAFHDHTVMNKPVSVQRVKANDKLDGCHLLYIGTGGRRDFSKSIASLQQAAVLTVSERSTTTEAGEVVGLPQNDARVAIQVNLRAAQSSKLTISSRLLQIATVTERP